MILAFSPTISSTKLINDFNKKGLPLPKLITSYPRGLSIESITPLTISSI
jgi:hypothetical protein